MVQELPKLCEHVRRSPVRDVAGRVEVDADVARVGQEGRRIRRAARGGTDLLAGNAVPEVRYDA